MGPRALAFGDSVMWGQGIRHEDTFPALICEDLGVPFRQEDNRAHSGARLGTPGDGPHVSGPGDPISGEVPAAEPTVFSQVASVDPAHEAGVEHVFVNGGINDLGATDYTFGFDTAVAIATDAMDRLRTTGESHHRCMVAEVMGRHAGWIALHSGMSAGAHAVLIPEQRVTTDELCSWVSEVHVRGRAPLVVVAEGFIPEGHEDVLNGKGSELDGRPRLGGVGDFVVAEIERRTGIETRGAALGHVQRGGAPTGYDRVLATRMGMAATDMVNDHAWGQMVALRGTEIERVDFAEALSGLKTVPQHRWDEAKALFGR